ncbi:MAG: 8-oxoguanine DNA glycosylase [Gammaproteobacteria bacterium]|nr:8-oxoguanine DNA glycosylase [Gammaproteobacteria bacterium]
MQIKTHFEDGKCFECNIPDENEEVMHGVLWGCASKPFTPAYWRLICITNNAVHKQSIYHLGTSLKEEVVACLLGGHGITGELGLAAYNHLRLNHVLDADCPYTAEQIESLLREPLVVDGRSVRYRYPHQKAKYIYSAIGYLNANTPPNNCGKSLRNWLTAIPGIGYKTASWVARNWLDAQDVAILDIHIHRAGILAGIFSPNDDVRKDYLRMEENFIILANGISVPANILDNLIWSELRQTPRLVRQMLTDRGVSSSDRCGLPPTYNRNSSRNYELFTST